MHKQLLKDLHHQNTVQRQGQALSEQATDSDGLVIFLPERVYHFLQIPLTVFPDMCMEALLFSSSIFMIFLIIIITSY